jgi:hypothetical protein
MAPRAERKDLMRALLRLATVGLPVFCVVVLTAAGASAQTGDRDCRDFGSQADAQAALNADPSDPNRLDADADGEACEEFSYGPAGAVAAEPANLASTGAFTVELAALGLAAVVVGGILVRLGWGRIMVASPSATRARSLLDEALR